MVLERLWIIIVKRIDPRWRSLGFRLVRYVLFNVGVYMIKKDQNKMALVCIPDFEESYVDICSFVECRALSVQPAVPIVTETTRYVTT